MAALLRPCAVAGLTFQSLAAGLSDPLFWGSMAAALAVAAFPVSRWLIARGRGHAVVHAHHGHGGATPSGHR